MTIHSRRFLMSFAGALSGLLIGGVAGAAGAAGAAEPVQINVITLTQRACQFVEAENGIDRGYTTTVKADCEAINARSGDERLAEAETLELKPGAHVFRVTNVDVPYELGFWLRGEGVVNRTLLPSVSGGGLATGATKDYVVELKPGDYVYSCPLNPTPDYRLVVKG